MTTKLTVLSYNLLQMRFTWPQKLTVTPWKWGNSCEKETKEKRKKSFKIFFSGVWMDNESGKWHFSLPHFWPLETKHVPKEKESYLVFKEYSHQLQEEYPARQYCVRSGGGGRLPDQIEKITKKKSGWLWNPAQK